MQEFKDMYHRSVTNTVRFTLPQLAAARGRVNRTFAQRREWARIVMQCGAVCVGMARVGPTNTMKDVVYSVPWAQWEAFVALLDAGPVVPEPHKQEPRLTLEQRVARLEAYVAGLASTDIP